MAKRWDRITGNLRDNANSRTESEREYDKMLEELPKLDPAAIVRYREKTRPTTVGRDGALQFDRDEQLR